MFPGQVAGRDERERKRERVQATWEPLRNHQALAVRQGRINYASEPGPLTPPPVSKKSKPDGMRFDTAKCPASMHSAPCLGILDPLPRNAPTDVLRVKRVSLKSIFLDDSRRLKDISNILYFIFYVFWVRGKMIERIVIFFFYLLIRSFLLINRDKVKECNSVDFSLVLAARSRTMKEWVDRKMAILDRRRVSHTG